MTFEASCVEKQEVAGNEYGCVNVPALSDNMIKSCCPELQCRSVFLVPELSCSKNPNRFTMIKDNFHAQKPNPNSLTPSLSTLPARSQTQHSLYKTTDMLLWFPRSLLLVKPLHSLWLLVLTIYVFFFFLCWFGKSVEFSGIRVHICPLFPRHIFLRP